MNRLKSLFALVVIVYLFACNKKQALFQKISSSHSGITFNNLIDENDSINALDLVNIYNGGGVGIGDFNNDGLPDIYFTGNRVSNKLYLNKGDFRFDDITTKAGVDGMGRWGRGAAIVDINNDGLPDIYVCNTVYKDSMRRTNLLYVNQGPDKDGIPHFTDMAEAYGLNVRAQSTMANFFDYDNDGDLDMYLTVNSASYNNNPNQFGGKIKDPLERSRGKLFKNDWDAAAKHPVFHDVSEVAGIVDDGFGHGATIVDINRDGWKDVYVTNDFVGNNILYINNHNGAFTNEIKTYLKHTSYNAMGQDITDINNDGLADIIELDMSPEDNYRKKMMLNAGNYNTYQNFDQYHIQHQYIRNTLQLNQGPRLYENDSIGEPIFSEIGFMSGMSQTDWSWAPVVTDFNNDTYRDIIITNGFPKDVSDHDFISYRNKARNLASREDMMAAIPQIKLHNYAYQNTGNLSFVDETSAWGLSESTFSSGAAVADFDNNGTMDMVISNIGGEALLYKNTLRDKTENAPNFLQVKFTGDEHNINGLGAWVEIYYNKGKLQVFENTPYRGYLSSMQAIAHFGLGTTAGIDSLIIKWPNGQKQSLTNVRANQVLNVNIKNARESYTWNKPQVDSNAVFREVTSLAGITYKHQDVDFIDFNIQTTLLHKLSEYSPALAAGDVNGDGLDDIIAGGSSSFNTQVLLQQANGKFTQRDLYPGRDAGSNNSDEGILLFDANGDGKPDVFIAGGGFKNAPLNRSYADKLFINDGKGNFMQDTMALPKNYASKLCVRAMDFNADGKLDLFVSGRVEPGKYPRPVSSYMLRNDSDKDRVKFTDVTGNIAPALKNIGLVCDALFTDFDNDNKPDLVLAGEWMPITFLKNVNGKFVDVTAASGLGDKAGWWNSIVAGDFRHTGRTDYIVGNVGLNTFYQSSNEYPVYVTAKDYDNNGSFVPIPSLYLRDEKGVLKEFPANGRDEIIERVPTMKKRFDHYSPFAKATMNEVLTPAQREGALRLKATMLQSCFLQNDGNGRFTLVPLPRQAQISALSAMTADDYDGDGNLDVLISGNDFGTEVSVGRYDALNGLLLRGDGKGGFLPLSIQQSGIYMPGNSKALVKFRSSSGKYLVAGSENKGRLKLFELKRNVRTIPINPTDVSAIITYRNGKTRKEEFYYGSSFLSQSARFITADGNVTAVSIVDGKGISRNVNLAQ